MKQAVRIAHDYFRELYEGREVEDLRLEEVELSEMGDCWYVTLGFNEPSRRAGFAGVLGVPPREYKVFKINAGSGAVQSMKMRKAE